MTITKPKTLFIAAISVLGAAALAIATLFIPQEQLHQAFVRVAPHNSAIAATIGSSFNYDFRIDGELDEAGSMDDSWSPYFWLNSGGRLYLEDGVGKTIQGELPTFSKWRLAYSAANPRDTDDGYHPQNLFRLVTRDTWKNLRQDIEFRITKINMTDTPHRGAWSGVLLMSRYQDGDNLYYAGIRMDGAAVIKKKHKGTYYTMDYARNVYEADASYHAETNPNRIPDMKWIGLRSVVENKSNGDVEITLLLDRNNDGTWEQIAHAIDDGSQYGSGVIRGTGHAGVRTDYMDAEFDNYDLMEL